MRHSLKKSLLEYFGSIQNRNEKEEELFKALEVDVNYYDTTAVCAEDVQAAGFDISDITEDELNTIADRLDTAYLENGFWTDLRNIAEYEGFESTEDKNFDADDNNENE